MQSGIIARKKTRLALDLLRLRLIPRFDYKSSSYRASVRDLSDQLDLEPVIT